MERKLLGVILLTLAVLLALPCLLGIMRLTAGLMSFLFFDPLGANKITPFSIGTTVVLSSLDITLFVYGAKFIKRPAPKEDDTKEEETGIHNNPT